VMSTSSCVGFCERLISFVCVEIRLSLNFSGFFYASVFVAFALDSCLKNLVYLLLFSFILQLL
jgi:hypothetical protein